MSRRRAAQRPRSCAGAGPDATCNRAASRVGSHTTARSNRFRASGEPAALLTDAEVILSAASWLASLGAWLAEEITLADGQTVTLTRADAERMAEGLRRCVEGLDTVSVDVSQLPDPTPPPPDGTPSLSSPSPRTHQ